MRIRSRTDGKGQSAVEFVLVAPLLFLVLFSILQLAYLGLSALAVQRAANAVAREASIVGSASPGSFAGSRPILQCAIALTPLSFLDRKAALTALAGTRVEITRHPGTVTAQVRYPMPLSVPVVQRLFGEPFVPGSDGPGLPSLKDLQKWLPLPGLPAPPVPSRSLELPYVRWLTASATVHDESAD